MPSEFTPPRRGLQAPPPLPPGVSVVVPVYNSEQSLPILLERLAAVLPTVAPAYDAYEVILVNDGSRDTSWAVIGSLTERYPFVSGISHMRNYGQHNALLRGILAARYDTIITMDDDLQHPPEEMGKLLAKLAEGYDVVYGTPQDKPKQDLWRFLSSQIIRRSLASVIGIENARNMSPYRAIRTLIREAFRDYQSPYVVIDVLLSWGTTRYAGVPVRHDARKFGKSTYTVRKLVNLAVNLTTGFSIWPLQVASLFGFMFMGFGALLLAYVLIRFVIEGGSVPGFPFLASVIIIFSGVQLLILGIMGEYMGRIHLRSLNRPTSVVREVCGAIERPAEHANNDSPST